MNWNEKIKNPESRKVFEKFREENGSDCFEGVVAILNRLDKERVDLKKAPDDPRFYDLVGAELFKMKQRTDSRGFYNRKYAVKNFFDYMKWPPHAGLIFQKDRFTGKWGRLAKKDLKTAVRYMLAAVDRNEPLNSLKNRKAIFWYNKFGEFFTRNKDEGPDDARIQIHAFLALLGQDFCFESEEGEVKPRLTNEERRRIAGEKFRKALDDIRQARRDMDEAAEKFRDAGVRVAIPFVAAEKIREGNEQNALAQEKIDRALAELDNIRKLLLY